MPNEKDSVKKRKYKKRKLKVAPRRRRKLKLKRLLHRFSLLILVFLIFLSLPGQNRYLNPKFQLARKLRALPFDLPEPAPYPVNRTGKEAPPVSAEGAVILDLPSNVVIYKKNENSRFHPASTTKIATALVALDSYKPEQILVVKTIGIASRGMDLSLGEKITAENLLYGTLVHSANDAAIALADNYQGGLPAFVEAMNRKVKALNLTDTHFTNPIGFENSQHYTTPADMARLTASALNNPVFTRMVSIKAITVPDAGFTRYHELSNVNNLLGKIPGVSGVKTGYTQSAGECLITTAQRNGREVIIVLLKSADRFGETAVLIDWVFGNFSWEIPSLLQSTPGQ